MEPSELLIVIFGIPGLLAAGCVSGVLLLGLDFTILVTGVTLYHNQAPNGRHTLGWLMIAFQKIYNFLTFNNLSRSFKFSY